MSEEVGTVPVAVEQPEHTPGFVRMTEWSEKSHKACLLWGLPSLEIEYSDSWRYGGWFEFRNEADARECVARWNAHESLVATVYRLLTHFDNTQMSDPEAFPGIAETLREARLAVARATTRFPF